MEFLPLQLYYVGGCGDYFAQRREVCRIVVDRQRITSLCSGPVIRNAGLAPGQAQSRTIPRRPSSIAREVSARTTATDIDNHDAFAAGSRPASSSFTAASGQRSRPSRGDA
jgi:hypothetical protein